MEGNYYARRKFALFRNLLEYMGVEPGRLHFSWISSAESTKFVDVATKVIEEVRALGPAGQLAKTKAQVA
ncbi:MAG: hydrogenase iron-sulfur subunit [Deltaproteobacteria bacterium]|nr:hydrogenase iron-sulfur subunit [Deltaproteobacteria bacterium]